MTVTYEFTTAGLAADQRAVHWNSAIADAYFPLALRFAKPLDFHGKLDKTRIGRTQLSRLRSEPVQYERLGGHIRSAEKEDYLITIPQGATVEFRQLGRDVSCDPGGFIIERGDEPYRFSYQRPNDLYVLKVDKSDLAERIRQPDQHCARVFDGTQGIGALFVEMVRQAHSHATSADTNACEVVSRQILELLALAIKNEAGATGSMSSCVRAAHLLRIEKFIHENIRNPDLSPDLVASACGISKRYLHDLFKDVNGTVAQQIRDKRLSAAKTFLRERPGLAIAEVAYRYGFTDQAQFSRLFKTKFKITPTEYKRSDPLNKLEPRDRQMP
ncbi:MAG TPA: helix-turn-helix domain-containing protein [Roseovarius sp.]